jgi:amino acid transporter
VSDIQATPFTASVPTGRDHGLVRGIGTAAFAASIVNGVVGAGIFTLPATVSLEAGQAAPLAYFVCAIVMAGVVICFAAAGSRVPTSGGVYGTVEAAFGPATGFVVGILLLVSDLLASGGVAALVADTVGAIAPALATGASRAAVIVALFGLLTAANLVGVRHTARLITAGTAVKILPLLFFLLLGLVSLSHPPPAGPPPAPVTLGGFGRAMILTLFAMCGMETPLAASGELRHAHRELPRALFAAMLGVVALYLGIQLTAQHLLGATLAHSITPLADAAGRIGPLPRAILLSGAFISALVWMASDVLGSSRLLFAFGRDGRLPAWFGGLTSATHVPARAVFVYVIAAALLAITGSFLELIVLSTLTVIGMYSLACAAAVVLQRRGVARDGPPMTLRWLPVAAGIGLAGMAAMLVSARLVEVLGLIGVIAGSLVLYWATEGKKKAVLF